MELEIPLGVANSKLYEKNGHTYYKIWPILGLQINYSLDNNVSELKVNGDTIEYGKGFYKLTLAFKECNRFTSKVHIKPKYFWIVPFGISFGEISNKNKEMLFAAIKDS